MLKKIKIIILKHKINKGLGMALKTGFKYTLKKANDNDVIVTMDTDNSHTIQLSYLMANKVINENKLDQYSSIVMAFGFPNAFCIMS